MYERFHTDFCSVQRQLAIAREDNIHAREGSSFDMGSKVIHFQGMLWSAHGSVFSRSWGCKLRILSNTMLSPPKAHSLMLHGPFGKQYWGYWFYTYCPDISNVPATGDRFKSINDLSMIWYCFPFTIILASMVWYSTWRRAVRLSFLG